MSLLLKLQLLRAYVDDLQNSLGDLHAHTDLLALARYLALHFPLLGVYRKILVTLVGFLFGSLPLHLADVR